MLTPQRQQHRPLHFFQVIWSALLIAAVVNGPLWATTYVGVWKTCPVGGQRFSYPDISSDSTGGSLPDGMPLGAGSYPFAPPQCPDNGLVMYRDFKASERPALAQLVSSDGYKAQRAAGNTLHYLAYQTAKILGDLPTEQAWLLLAATWEAKNERKKELTGRYNAEFVALVGGMPVADADFTSIALRARAANALREQGQFAEAEALRTSIIIAPAAGGTDANAADNRAGWADYLTRLQAAIARGNNERVPIALMPLREAGMRCLGSEIAAKFERPSPLPLTTDEAAYCASPAMKETVESIRANLAS